MWYLRYGATTAYETHAMPRRAAKQSLSESFPNWLPQALVIIGQLASALRPGSSESFLIREWFPPGAEILRAHR